MPPDFYLPWRYLDYRTPQGPAHDTSAADVISPFTSSAPPTASYGKLVLGLTVANGLAWGALAVLLFSPEVAAVTLALSAAGTVGILSFIAGATRE